MQVAKFDVPSGHGKGSDIADFSLKTISAIEQKINTMERQVLGGLSASQAKRSKFYEPAA